MFTRIVVDHRDDRCGESEEYPLPIINDNPLKRDVPFVWQFFILLTSIGVLLILALSLLMQLPAEIKRVLDIADYVICAIFMADFLVLLYLHKDRRRYLITWGWIDFLSSIPLVDPLRWGRLARVVRLLRLFRGLRGSAGLLRRLFANKRETTVAAILLTLICVAVFSSVAILIAEEGSGSNIHTAEDALWWTLTTMTTVGYGDMAPVTTLGRVVAVLTMFAGIGIFGAFTALIASFLVKPSDDGATFEEIAAQLKEQDGLLRKLQAQLDSLKEGRKPRSHREAHLNEFSFTVEPSNFVENQ